MTELQQRLHEILRRHVRDEDSGLSDHELVTTVIARYYIERDGYLVDPNE